jgi:hypothetical protein
MKICHMTREPIQDKFTNEVLYKVRDPCCFQVHVDVF